MQCNCKMTSFIFCAVIAVFAVSKNVSQAQTDNSKSLVVVMPEIPRVIDPHLAKTGTEVALSSEIYMGLVSHGADGKIVSGLAVSWEVSPDGLTYTFDLGPDARWSDGRRVSTSDIAEGLRRALNPATSAPYAGHLKSIEGAAAVLAGRLPPEKLGVSSLPFGRVEIALERPSSRFLDALSLPVAFPIPEHAMDVEGGWSSAEHLISAGAFTAVPSAESLSLAKNMEFFSARDVGIDRIEFVQADTPLDASDLVSSGQAHIAQGFPLEIGRSLSAGASRIDAGTGLYFVAVNVSRRPLDSREARHALAMTIDRDRLIDELQLIDIEAALKVVPPSILGEAVSPVAPYAALFPEMRTPIAEVLLQEANVGLNNPRTLTLDHLTEESHALVARHLAAAWAPLGILLDTRPRSSAELDQIMASGEFDLALAFWPHEGNEPVDYLQNMASSAGPLNISQYKEEDFDNSLQLADASLFTEGLSALYGEAEGIIIQDQPILPIFFYKPRHAVHPSIQGWVSNAHGIHPLRFLTIQ